MADPTGFLKHTRQMPAYRPVPVRVLDWDEVYDDFPPASVATQASRCMDCGIPFCTSGCPLGNVIPDWNDLVYRNRCREAIERLHATNNFPEFTGRLCPAPCESACVLGISQPAVTIKQVEVEIIDRAWEKGWIPPVMPTARTGKRVAIVGSGPAGLATAQQLTRAGHDVSVFERDDRLGGLLRYGIPSFKLEKRHLDRRLDQMRSEGTRFWTSTTVGVDITGDDLRKQFDAVVLAGGATVRRELPIPGRDLRGIHQAMEFLPLANRVQEGDFRQSPVSAYGHHVVIIGGGDTGADCLGTAVRQGALSVHQFEIMPRPPAQRSAGDPWPTYPTVFRVASAHEEGVERMYSVETAAFLGDGAGRVRALRAHRVERVVEHGRLSFVAVAGSEFELPCTLVLLAMGFTGAEPGGLIAQLGLAIDTRGNVTRRGDWQTSARGVFVCGDMGRGQSLIVWAIAEGRACAAAVDRHLMGQTTLPVPIRPDSVSMR